MTGLAEISKVQRAYSKEKAVMNRTTVHSSLKGTGQKKMTNGHRDEVEPG